MRKLYLLRHAQAASTLNFDDKDRPLSPHGIEQAKSLAPYISNIDIAFCSSAKRTQMTLNALRENGAEIKKIELLDNLYNAPMGEILSTIQSCDDKNILIIAHNPAIHQLAGTLAGKGDKEKLEKVRLFYNPATLSIFDCDIDSWEEIQPQANTLVDLIIPD